MAAALARTHGTILESTETGDSTYDLKKALLTVPCNKPAALTAFGLTGRTSKTSTVRKCARRFTVINPWTAHESPDSVLKDFGVEMRCHAATDSERFSLPLKELRVFQSDNTSDDNDVYEFIYEAWYYGGSCCAGPNCGSQNKNDNSWSFLDTEIELSLNPLLESLTDQQLEDKNALKDSEQTLFQQSVAGKKIRRCFKIANKSQDNDLDQSFKFRVSNAPKVSASIEYRERYNRMELNRVKVSMTGKQLREYCQKLCPQMRALQSKQQDQDNLHLLDEHAMDFDSSMDFDTEEDNDTDDSETGQFDTFELGTQELTDDDSAEDLAETETDLTIVGSSTFIFDDDDDEDPQQSTTDVSVLNLASLKLQSGLLLEEEDSGVWE